MDNPEYWDRTLDIEGLPIVSEYVRSRGYVENLHFRRYAYYLLRNRKKLPELKPKLKILDKMIKKKVLF